MDIFNDNISHDNLINELRLLLPSYISNTLSNYDCLRFLRARPGNIHKSIEMINNWYNWRHTLLESLPPDNIKYSPNIIISMSTTLDEHPAASLLPVAHHGFDRLGHPIYWEKTGLIQSQFAKVRQNFEVFELLQYSILSREIFCCRYEYASELYNKNISQCVVVNDMKGLTISLDMESIWYMKQVLQIDSNYYPERLYRLFLINCPWYFPAIFNIFSPFIDARTRDKFRILGSNYSSELEELIDPSVIPVEYGGTNETVKWDIKPSFESGGSKEQIRQNLDKHLKDLAQNCKEPEYQTLKEALKLSKKYKQLKELILFRFDFINELPEDQTHILSEIRVDNNNTDNNAENENNEEKTEGFTKENLLKRLKVDLEQTEKILFDLGMNENDNGEIDGGGDDRAGGKISSSSTKNDNNDDNNDNDDDNEFQDAR